MAQRAAKAHRIAVIGGGWAGLAGAVEATQRGHAVTLFEMASSFGGRARGIDSALDNGQHILIGAYRQTLRLMQVVGVDPAEAFLRTPLRLVDAAGRGISLQPGTPVLAFAQAVWRHADWSRHDRIALLRTAAAWTLRRFRASESASVHELTACLPAPIRRDLIDPLCVAALNTPARQASASIFLRVLRDALFAGPGSADLLLPRARLSELFPTPAARWLADAGATLRPSRRVQQLEAIGGVWHVDGEPFDRVVLATSSTQAARLVRAFAAPWAARAHALQYEPIITVYLDSPATRLPWPMIALASNQGAPAQFVFDHGHLNGQAGLLAFVISGAGEWVARGAAATLEATMAQARHSLGSHLRGPLTAVRLLMDKRATFCCTPGLLRPPASIAPGLYAAGDYIAGPYPATLEAAVQSGIAAACALG